MIEFFFFDEECGEFILLQVVLEEGLRMLHLRSGVTNLDFLHECMERHSEW